MDDRLQELKDEVKILQNRINCIENSIDRNNIDLWTYVKCMNDKLDSISKVEGKG